MKSIKDFNDYQVETLTEKVIEYAKLSNAYYDYEVSEEQLNNAALRVLNFLLHYLGVDYIKRVSKGNSEVEFHYYSIDGKEVK